MSNIRNIHVTNPNSTTVRAEAESDAPRKTAPVKARKISAEKPEARDEGPRLIPAPRTNGLIVPGQAKYLELADMVLGTRKPDPPKARRKAPPPK